MEKDKPVELGYSQLFENIIGAESNQSNLFGGFQTIHLSKIHILLHKNKRLHK